MAELERFESWDAVLAHIRLGAQRLHYHAPLDRRPALVSVRLANRGRRVRVAPLGKSFRSVYAFTADASHLARFWRWPLPADAEANAAQ